MTCSRQRSGYYERMREAFDYGDQYRQRCKELWDEHGFPEEELPETFEANFSLWVPEPLHGASVSVNIVEDIEGRLAWAMREDMHTAVNTWVKPFEFKEMLSIGEGLKYSAPDVLWKNDPRWTGRFYQGKQLVKGQKHFLSLAEGRTYEELWVNWAGICIHVIDLPPPSNEGGVRVPIGFTGLEARLMVGQPLSVLLNYKVHHPKFPRHRYQLTAGRLRKPIFKLMPADLSQPSLQTKQ